MPVHVFYIFYMCSLITLKGAKTDARNMNAKLKPLKAQMDDKKPRMQKNGTRSEKWLNGMGLAQGWLLEALTITLLYFIYHYLMMGHGRPKAPSLVIHFNISC